MKSLLQLSFFALLLATVGCATMRSVKVDAISSGAVAPGRAFHIVPASPAHAANDLRFIEASQIVARALTQKGFSEASDDASADIVIALDFAVSAPRSVSQTRVEPMVDTGFYSYARVPVRTRSGGIVYVRAGYWNPGPIAFGESTYTATYYDKRLSITAYSAKAGGEELPQIWSVVVSSREDNSDIRAALPSLVVAAVRHVGDDTHGETHVTISADDPDVVRVAPAVAK